MTEDERAILGEAIAQAMAWADRTQADRDNYRHKAGIIAKTLDRAMNSGTTIHLRQAILKAVEKAS